MKKIVDFGINESSRIGRLYSGQDKMDLVNGTGDYLGMLEIGGKNLMFTRTTRSGRNEHNGEIRINEVDYDMYPDGSMAVYYNLYRTEGIKSLERAINNPTFIRLLESGKTIKEVLMQLRVVCNDSYIDKIIEADFKPSREYIYPEGYDFEKSMVERDSYERKNEVKKVPVELLMVTGIDREYFEDLIYTKLHMHYSLYQMAHMMRKMEEELANKQNQR